jgi:hypothetical protein
MPKQRSRSANPEPFTVADAHTIIEAVQRLGNAPLLTRRLNDLRLALPLYQSLGAAGGATLRERAFAGLARSPRKLPKKLASLPDGAARGVLRYELGRLLNPLSAEQALADGSVDVRIASALAGDSQAIDDVLKAVGAARRSAQSEPRRARAERHRPDISLQLILRELLLTFEEVFRIPAAISLSRPGDEGGPLIRFLEGVLPRLGYPLTLASIRSHLQRLPKDHWPHFIKKTSARDLR